MIKILATTLGETGGDAVTMSWLGETTAAGNGAGYLIGTAIFGVIFVAAVLVQIIDFDFHLRAAALQNCYLRWSARAGSTNG